MYQPSNSVRFVRSAMQAPQGGDPHRAHRALSASRTLAASKQTPRRPHHLTPQRPGAAAFFTQKAAARPICVRIKSCCYEG